MGGQSAGAQRGVAERSRRTSWQPAAQRNLKAFLPGSQTRMAPPFQTRRYSGTPKGCILKKPPRSEVRRRSAGPSTRFGACPRLHLRSG